MNLKPVLINVIENHNMAKPNNIDIIRDLEGIDLHTLNVNMEHKVNNSEIIANKSNDTKAKTLVQSLIKPSTFKSHADVFQSSLKYCVTSGQFIGLFPFVRVSEKDNKIRYTFLFSRYLLCLIIFIIQIIAALLCLYKLINSVINIYIIAFFSFYTSNCVTSILFMRLATKWDYLTQVVAAAGLDEYIDQYVKFKCNLATISIVCLAFVEHILSLISKFADATDCRKSDVNLYEHFIRTSYPWVFDLNIQYSIIAGIYLPIMNWVTAMIWCFPHIFIICMSFYLTSILEELNKKILSVEGKYLPVAYWRTLREDYNRATQLVRSFDDVINSIVFISFASNLFFVCLQLYYILARGIKVSYGDLLEDCPHYPSGLFYGYEHVIYFSFSLTFVLTRSLAVLLIASKVHSASLVAAPSLYNVPSPTYCTEVQRFLDQIHGSTVALTGLNFFYVTKELVLSVVGTIVTYELVLLQFNGESENY